MFETSIWLLIFSIFINIFVPILTGILFIWIFFRNIFQWIILYILSFFIGTWVIAFSIFNMQFFHFWVWKEEYIFINIILLIIFIWKIYFTKEKCSDYFSSLKISFNFLEINNSYNTLPKNQKWVFFTWSIFVILFLLISFVFNTNFPNYADDSFWNWNKPAVNIYHDGGFKMFWEKEEILWKARLGYPIYVPIYRAVISDISGWYNDIYIKLWQYLWFLFLLVFIFHITFLKTKNIFYSIIPLVLICWLPLIFFHLWESYLEIASAIYTIFMIYYLYEFLETEKLEFLSLWILFWVILSHIKNDGIVIYFAGTIIALWIFLIFKKKFVTLFKKLWKNKKELWIISFFTWFFFLPFIVLKSYLWLWYNQAAWEASWVWIEFHPEIFSAFPHIFFNQDNYNIALVFIILLLILIWRNRTKNIVFIWLSFIMIISLFTAVFLFTTNYKWVIDQTTVNRVFTMSFVILFAFTWLILNENIHKKNI